MRGPDRVTRTVLVVSLVLATSIPIGWRALTPPADAGVLPSEVTNVPAASTGGDDAADGTIAPPAPDAPEAWTVARDADAGTRSAPAPAATVGTRSARIADQRPTQRVAPTRLRIPSLDVDASVGAIGVQDDGAMEVPDDVRNVGWYRFGPAPGQRGATVIAGHVDSREQGPGAFFDLRRLQVGARVTVTDSAGDVQRYDVVARRTYDKAVLPTDELFSRRGRPRLVLITCGGDFDQRAGSYRNNVVVYAEPASSSP